MTMQFLPWVRRGLSAEIDHADDGSALPLRASFPVRVTVNGSHASVDVDTYGPGDVTGLDIAAIARTTPRRFATNVAPDEFPAVEFSVPDLPWMFTPATATLGRLRPWLVLVVLTDTDGVSIGVDPSRPLPTLTIESPAVPAAELPDLAQSWAWAHAQAVTAKTGDDPVAALDGQPGQRLSRLLCPRRLLPGTRYLAALVPAFDVGVDAGLGRTSNVTEVSPAWDHASLGDSITVPVYYHWEFTTGPPGDFESLARRLRPMEVPGTVGESPMFIGDAHPALPTLTADSGGVVPMEGALRAPLPGAGSELDARHAAWIGALTALVDRTAVAANGGTATDAEAVAPPIYAQWHVGVHQIPAVGARPKWLRDLNADPRHRAAAGLGAEVVRANQETYMDAAWKQVGDVMAANRLLALSRAMAAITDRIHDRHVVGIDPVRALNFVDRAQTRLPVDGRSLSSVIDASAALPGFTSRSFRRLSSPRNAMLRQGERRAGNVLAQAASADIAPFERIGLGDLAVDATRLPDSIRSSTLPDAARALVGTLGLDAVAVGTLVQELDRFVNALDGVIVGPPVVRPDLGRVGVLTDDHVSNLRHVTGLTDDLLARTSELRAALGERGAGTIIGVIAGADGIAVAGVREDGRIIASGGGVKLELTQPVLDTTATPPPDATWVGGRPAITGFDRTISLTPAMQPVRSDPTSSVGPTLPGVHRRGEPIDASGSRPTVRATTVGGDRHVGATIMAVDPTFAGLDRVVRIDRGDLGDLAKHVGTLDVTVIPSIDTSRFGFEQFVTSFTGLDHTRKWIRELLPVEPVPVPLNTTAVRDAIVSTSRPRPVIEARLASRLRTADGLALIGTHGRIEVHQLDPVAPVMVGPVLDRPLYLDLAAFDQGRFLPGAGDIPSDTITLLETNPRFVESFMVGANHEFNRELLWRRYPTDRRSTALRRFWDRIDDGDDIDPIHEWQGTRRLGSNGRGDADGSIVLLVRGELLRRFPNAVVYAAAATSDRRIDVAATPINAVFAGSLEPDITFVGFDIDVVAATAGNGTMFVIQEQPAEPRFGLDVPRSAVTVGAPQRWSDLTWGHVGVEPGGHLDVEVFATTTQLPLAASAPTVTARFGADAAHMAAITFQRPFRVAVHSSEILP